MNTLEQIGSQRITRLAEIENVTQPTMTLLIDKLQLMGLVERHRDNDDRRATLISLTVTGKSYLNQRRRIGTERIADLIINLPSEETNLLIDALTPITNLSRIGSTIFSSDRSVSHPTKGGSNER
ncbi:MAG: winged helix-turn-helix transcriptional regulator [Acidimicrobiaceae bacterium]|nr:winged helix-turn-helix transcriptional regulator [Acidimicrobiaceae bacterium]